MASQKKEEKIQEPVEKTAQEKKEGAEEEKKEKVGEAEENIVEKKEKQETEKKQKTKKEKFAEKEKLKELVETLQRVQADFENYKKRVEKEKQDFARFACSGIITELLPILDNFEVALKNTSNEEEFVKGVEMIYAQLLSTLEKAGLMPIEADGKLFDPHFHEALMQEESDKENGTIIEEFQKGYLLNDAVLRHAKVKISKGKFSKPAEESAQKEKRGAK